MFDLKEKTFEGPNGVVANFYYRADCADENTIQATFSEDEYGFASKCPIDDEFLIDLGGYVGSTAILWAKLYPKSKVIVVEPLPENIDMIKKNVLRNNLVGQVIVYQNAISNVNGATVKTFYRDDSEVGITHRFVGSGYPQYHETVSQNFSLAETINLDKIFACEQIQACRVLKMDIEGAEYDTLKGCSYLNLSRIETIVGEYHNITPKTEEKPRSLLFSMTQNLFNDCSSETERNTWGSFLFESNQ